MLILLTEDLKKHLPLNHKLIKHNTINSSNFTEMYNVLQKNVNKELTIYDYTFSKKQTEGKIIPIKDHINKTGTNILINKQKLLNIDFIDLSDIYHDCENGVITTCCGSKLDEKLEYCSHYLCSVTILAKAMGFKKIKAFLVRT